MSVTSSRAIAVVALFTAGFGNIRCSATATWEYKAGQFVNIDHGLAPDHRYAIAASEDTTGKFGLFLMDGVTRKKIWPLEEVSDEALDTAPEAFHAEWAPDSRHVAISYRIDRHLQDLLIYRIENRRAFPVTGLDLLQLAAPAVSVEKLDIRSAFYSLRWQGAGKFLLIEQGSIYLAEGENGTLRALGKFGKTDPDGASYINYSIEALCELASDDRYRVLKLTPGELR